MNIASVIKQSTSWSTFGANNNNNDVADDGEGTNNDAFIK